MSANPLDAPVPNPVHDSFNISVLVPEEIKIRMVDASALADYEIWFFISSILASAVVGFLIAYLQAKDLPNSQASTPLFWMAAILALLFAIAFFMAIGKRALLRKEGRTLKLKTSVAND